MTTTLRRADLPPPWPSCARRARRRTRTPSAATCWGQLPRLVPTTMISYNDISPDGDAAAAARPARRVDATSASAHFLAWRRRAPAHLRTTSATGDTRPMKISDLMGRREFRRTELYRGVYGPMGSSTRWRYAPPPPGDGGGDRPQPRPPRLRRARPGDARPAAPPPGPAAARRGGIRDAARLLESIGRPRARRPRPRRRRGGAGRHGRLRQRGRAATWSPPTCPSGGRRRRAAGDRSPTWRRRERRRGARALARPGVDGPRVACSPRLLPVAGARRPRRRPARGAPRRRGPAWRARGPRVEPPPGRGAAASVGAAGAPTPRSAADLHVSPRTVQKHLENIYDRLGVRSRAAATARAVRPRRPRAR